MAEPTDPNRAHSALRRNTNKILQSGIDPFILASSLDSAEIIPEDVYWTVTDQFTGMTATQRIGLLLKSLRASVKQDGRVFDKFISILREVGGKVIGEVLAEQLISSYKGKYMLYKHYQERAKCLFENIVSVFGSAT